jgi:hypothetical protein
MHTFEFEVNAAATSVDFWIDGTLVATNTTNIPSTTSHFTNMAPAMIVCTAGTSSSRVVYIDAYWYVWEWTTAR